MIDLPRKHRERSHPTPPVFLTKSLQAIENKESRRQKESKEKKSGCRLLKTQSEQLREKAQHRVHRESGALRPQRVPPRGDGKYAHLAENGGDIGVTWRI